MIISHKHKFCFVHIPKNAGTYVNCWLKEYHDHPFVFYDVKRMSDGVLKDLMHINLLDLQKYFGLCLRDYFVFCIVRDPVERFKSAYIQYRYHLLEYFKEYPKDISELLDTIDFSDTRYIHLVPQSHYTHDEDGNQVIPNIYRMDTFQTSICADLGFDGYPAGRINAGKSTSFDRYYKLSENDLARIRILYRRDYDFLIYI